MVIADEAIHAPPVLVLAGTYLHIGSVFCKAAGKSADSFRLTSVWMVSA